MNGKIVQLGHAPMVEGIVLGEERRVVDGCERDFLVFRLTKPCVFYVDGRPVRLDVGELALVPAVNERTRLWVEVRVPDGTLLMPPAMLRAGETMTFSIAAPRTVVVKSVRHVKPKAARNFVVEDVRLAGRSMFRGTFELKDLEGATRLEEGAIAEVDVRNLAAGRRRCEIELVLDRVERLQRT
jgi:hypothetical protein